MAGNFEVVAAHHHLSGVEAWESIRSSPCIGKYKGKMAALAQSERQSHRTPTLSSPTALAASPRSQQCASDFTLKSTVEAPTTDLSQH